MLTSLFLLRLFYHSLLAADILFNVNYRSPQKSIAPRDIEKCWYYYAVPLNAFRMVIDKVEVFAEHRRSPHICICLFMVDSNFFCLFNFPELFITMQYPERSSVRQLALVSKGMCVRVCLRGCVLLTD